MLNLLLNNDTYDIVYVGIGSAVVRDTDPMNRQQFPPFLESIYKNTNLRIHVINIDPKFEKPYFLTQYFNDLKKISNDVYIKDRLQVTYIDSNVYILEEDFALFDELNRYIMDNNKILICGNYTGYPVDTIENTFYDKYKNTQYNNKFNDYITYNFYDTDTNGCMCDLIENFPIIDLKNKKIVKLNNITSNTFLDIYNVLMTIDESYINKMKKIVLYNFNNFIDFNHYIFRNLKNNNRNDTLIKSIPKSIFWDNSTASKDELVNIFKTNLIENYSVIEFLFGRKYFDIINYIHTMECYNDYEWHNVVKKTLNS